VASIQRAVELAAPVDEVWSALRDVGAIHRRLAPGFVTNVKLEDGARIVTFGNGMTVRELLVDVDETAHRVAWSARADGLTHHNASAQVVPIDEGHCRFVWIADVLPNSAAPGMAKMIDQGMASIERHFAGPRA
jgi:hypothetical protein